MSDSEPQQPAAAEFPEPPPEFDYTFYTLTYPDVAGLSAAEASSHFRTYGESEGRLGSPLSWRGNFISLVDPERLTLEIGPFCQPVVRGKNVFYFDVLQREALIARAFAHNYPCEDPPEIHYVSPTGSLEAVPGGFEQVIASHCIEHQVDLVKHLRQVSSILVPGGRYYAIIPDKRFCFDHFIPESTIADVLGAYFDKRLVHSAVDVLENQTMTTHNDAVFHWAGEHGDPHWTLTSGVDRLQGMIAELEKANGGYIDTHAWQFTPASFRQLLTSLRLLGFCDLEILRVYNTPMNSQEFSVIMQKPL
jgi:SAM-dependent methyltransferase